MSNQDSPTPPAPAEVCERLKQLHRSLGSTSQDGYKNERATLTAALLLIEQGEKERERLLKFKAALASVINNLGNGSAASPEGSDEYLCGADVEAKLYCARLRTQLAAATERVTALEQDKERLKRKAEYFAYLIGTGRCPVITKWDGVDRHGYVSCIGVSVKAFEHALELAAQKLADIAARAQPTTESK